MGREVTMLDPLTTVAKVFTGRAAVEVMVLAAVEAAWVAPAACMSLASFFIFCLRWTFACLFFSSDRANLRPQVSQEKGFSPVWVLTWVVRWSDLEKDLMQIRHWNGFCPVWILIWRVNSSDRLNRRSQPSTGQAYGRSCTGVLEGLLGYFRSLTGRSFMLVFPCW